MNIIKRSIKNLLAHPFNSLAIFLVVAVLGAFLYTAISVSYSTTAIKEDFLLRIGLDVQILGLENDVSDDEFLFEHILDKHKDIYRFYDIRKSVTVEVDGLDYFNNDDFELNYLTFNSAKEKSIKDFDNGSYKLTKGRYFNKNELDEGAAVIIAPDGEYSIDDRSLEVGDFIDVILSGQKKSYEVVGLYEYNKEVLYDEDRDLDILFPYNNMEKNLKLFDRKPIVNLVDITLINPDDNYRFDAILKSYKIFDDVYKCSSNINLYNKVASPITNMSSLSKIIVIVSLIMIVLILSVLSFIFTHARRYEYGVLLAMGERKAKLITLNILDMFLLSLPAFTLSYLAGNIMIKVYTDKMIMNASSSVEISGISYADIVANYKIAGGFEMFQSLFIFLLYITIASSLVSNLYVVNIKIRNLLLK